MNKYIPLVSCMHLQLIHILARSPTVTVNSACVLAKHIQLHVESAFSQLWVWSQGRVQTTLSALFWSTITGVVVWGFRSSSVAVAHEG